MHIIEIKMPWDIQMRKFMVTDNIKERFAGLLPYGKMPEKIDGLLMPFNKLVKTPVHTHGMKFPIDVIFLDELYNIIERHDNVMPDKRNIIIVEFLPTIVPKVKYKYLLETEHGVI